MNPHIFDNSPHFKEGSFQWTLLILDKQPLIILSEPFLTDNLLLFRWNPVISDSPFIFDESPLF